MLQFRRVLIIVATLLTHVYTQVLTQQCLDSWPKIAGDPAASTCLSVQQALPLATAIQNNASVVPIFNNWLNSLCGQPECNKKTISAVFKLLREKCSQLDDWTLFDPKVYPTWRKADCLKNANGVLCTTEFLTNVESFSGTVTFAKFQKVVEGSQALPANITCTDCNKGQYSIFAKALPSDREKQAHQAQCGAAFVDGQIPPGITESANPAISTTTTTLKCRSLSSGPERRHGGC